MTAPFLGKYTNSIQFSAKKRYVVLQAQRNTPLLDAEVRELSENMLNLNRWLARNSFGDVAVISAPHSDYPGTQGSHRVDGFKAAAVGGSSSEQSLDFTVYGGLNNDGHNDTPAVLYLKGWYLFLSSDIKWSDQSDDPSQHLEAAIKEYPGEVLPDANSSFIEQMKYAIRSDTFVKDVGTLHAGNVGQLDVIYVELTLDEVTDGGSTPNPGEPNLQDPSLKDPVLAKASANRLKASMKFIVKENWSGTYPSSDPYDGSIFDHPFFEEGEYSTGVKYLRAPISVIRRSHSTVFSEGDFTDLLKLHDKRVYPPVELTHRLRHGGYTQNDVDAGRAVPSDVDERWGATGRNEGIDTEAFNTNSVTPRVVDKNGDYRIQSLALAGQSEEQGSTGPGGTMQPDANGLEPGEHSGKRAYYDRIAIEHGERTSGRTTIEDMRDNFAGSLFYMSAAGFTGNAFEVHTSHSVDGNGDDVPNNFWTQWFHFPHLSSPRIASQMDREGNLGLGKAVNGESGYNLDVYGRSNFDRHADFRGDTNHFWNGVGASGPAKLYDARWDRQINMYSSPVNSTGANAYWAVCEMEVFSSTAGEVNFILNVSSNGGSEEDRYARYKVRLNKVGVSSTPILKVAALSSHNMVGATLVATTIATSSTSRTVRFYLSDETGGREYSYNATDTQNKDSRLDFFSETSASWVPSVAGTIIASSSYFEYAEGKFSTLYADRLLFNSLAVNVDTAGTQFIYPLAKKPSNFLGTNYQSFTVVVRDPNLNGNMDMAFRLSVHNNGSDFGLTLTDLVSPNKSIYGESGLYRVGVGQQDGEDIIYFYIADATQPPSVTLRQAFVEVSVDPTMGPSTSSYPFTLMGRPDAVTVLSAIAAPSTIKVDTRVLSKLNPSVYNETHAALSTTERVHLSKDSTLDFFDQDTSGTTGANGNGGLIQDMFRNKGKDAQYLSAAMGGVMWRNTPVCVVNNIAELRKLNPSTLGADLVFVKGYYTANDGGGGMFGYNSASTTNDDGGVFIAYLGVNTNPGRFERYLENKVLSVYHYGAVPGVSSGLPLNRDTQLIAAISSAESNGYSLLIPSDSVLATATAITYPKSVSLTIESGVYFYYGGTGTRPVHTFEGPTTINSVSALTHPYRGPQLRFHPSALTEVRPEWWFAEAGKDSGSAWFDNTDSLKDMYASLSATISESAFINSNTRGITVVYGDNGRMTPSGNIGFYSIEGYIEITSPSKFVGSAGIRLGDAAELTVSSEIIAPNQWVFDYPDVVEATSYYCTSGPIYWGDRANGKLNVTWFNVMPETAASVPALRNLILNFDCQNNKVHLLFPDGTFDFGSGSALDFLNHTVEVSPGAALCWDQLDVTIRKLVDTPHTKFCFEKLGASGLRDAKMPYIGGGIIRSEWFRGLDGGLATDSHVLEWALGALTRTTRVLTKRATREELLGASISEGEGTVLDCGGYAYRVEREVEMFPGSGLGVSSSSRNLTVTKLNLAGVSGYTGSTLRTSFGTDGTYANATLGLTFENCVIAGVQTMGGPSESLVLNYAYDMVWDNNSFLDTRIYRPFALDGARPSHLTMNNNVFHKCHLEMGAISIVNATNNKFLYVDTVHSIPDSRPLLVIGGGSRVVNNAFEMTTSSSSYLSLFQALIFTGGYNIVESNEFRNSNVRVEVLYTNDVRNLIMCNNAFYASPGYTHQANQIPEGTFIEIVAPSEGATMENVVITGNNFNYEGALVPNVAMSVNPIVTAYEIVFEAINVIEDEANGGNYFDDESVFDVIVKDNVGSPNINVRGTEVVESVYVNRTITDSSVVLVPGNVGSSSSQAGNFVKTNSSKRLVGYPQEINVYAVADTAFEGWLSVSASYLKQGDYSEDDGSNINLPRNYPVQVYARHTNTKISVSLLAGFPSSAGVMVYTNFKTYQSRQDSINSRQASTGLYRSVSRSVTGMLEFLP